MRQNHRSPLPVTPLSLLARLVHNPTHGKARKKKAKLRRSVKTKHPGRPRKSYRTYSCRSDVLRTFPSHYVNIYFFIFQLPNSHDECWCSARPPEQAVVTDRGVYPSPLRTAFALIFIAQRVHFFFSPTARRFLSNFVQPTPSFRYTRYLDC